MPVQPPFWSIGSFPMTREALRSRMGDPHHVETDSLCTFGGEEDWWCFSGSDGQRLMICFHVPYGKTSIYADPPDHAAAESTLAQVIGDVIYCRLDPEPWPP